MIIVHVCDWGRFSNHSANFRLFYENWNNGILFIYIHIYYWLSVALTYCCLPHHSIRLLCVCAYMYLWMYTTNTCVDLWRPDSSTPKATATAAKATTPGKYEIFFFLRSGFFLSSSFFFICCCYFSCCCCLYGRHCCRRHRCRCRLFI